MDIDRLIEKAKQLPEKDALRRRIFENVATVVTAKDRKQREKAYQRVIAAARRLAY